jgi:hypothetical protein
VPSDPSDTPVASDQSLRRRSRLPLGIGVALVVAGAAAYGWQLRPPPYRLAVDPVRLTLSADDDPTGRELKREVSVEVVNTGRSAIAVTGVHSSCDCTVAGPVPEHPLAPGERFGLKLDVTLPYYGTKQTDVIVLTEPAGVQPAILVLQMHGRTVHTPLVSIVPGPAQLMANRPGEIVEHLFEVETLEAIDSDPWLTGMQADHHGARVELVGIDIVRENPAAQTLARRYEFLLQVRAPADERQVEAFSLTEQGSMPSVGRVQLYRVRVSCVPPVRAVPEEVLLTIDDDTVFPLTRTLELVPSDDQQELTISDLSLTSEWLTARVLAEAADAGAGSGTGSPLRMEVSLQSPPDAPGEIGGGIELIVSFENAGDRKLRVPVTLVDRRSLLASTPGGR